MELPRGLLTGLKRIALPGALFWCAGCRSWQDGTPPSFFSERRAPVVSAENLLLPDSAPSPADAQIREVLAAARVPSATGLGASVWTRRLAGDKEAPSEFRWRYPSLDSLLGTPEDAAPDWEALAEDPHPVVAANAAMAMVRLGRDAPSAGLIAAVADPTLPFEMRCAAAESLGVIRTPEATDAIRELIGRYGDYTPKGRSGYLGELHAELVRGLAERVDPCRDEMVLAAMRSPRPEVRLEAVSAAAASEPGPLPRAVVDARLDGQAEVRAAAIRAIVRHGHPKMLEYAGRALKDTARGPREAAIEALGNLADSESLSLLEKVMTEGGELDRVATVAAFASRGAKGSLFSASKDQSARVRLAVARGLAGFPGPEAESVARRLLSDPSGQVRAAAVAAVADWPLRRSGPILLDAMALRTTEARHLAASRLADEWPAALEFPVDADANERAAALALLRARYAKEVGFPEESLTVREQASGAPSERETAAVAELASADGDIRRRAARTLAALAVENPLHPASITRLVEITVGEDDPLLWQSVLEAVSKDGSAGAARLATAALGHPKAEVRRRACLYLTTHPDAVETRHLVEPLRDESIPVAMAAVGAVGARGPVSDPAVLAALESLLGGSDEMLRAAAAAVLASWDVPGGIRGLERAALSEAPSVRQKAAEAMGLTADPVFLPHLIRLLDDRQHVRVAALGALSKTFGDETAGITDSSTVTEKVTRWKMWYEQDGGIRTVERSGPPARE